MPLKLGITGLPNAGKTTLFNTLTGLAAKVSNFPFTTIESNHGIVPVPDSRPEELAKLVAARTWANSTLEVVDIAGLIKDSHAGAGLGNQFLDNLRNVDAVIQVVRAFKNPEIVHPLGEVNPFEDIEIINYELCLSDLNLIEKKIDKAKVNPEEKKVLEIIKENLARGVPARRVKIAEHFHEDASIFIGGLNLITAKPLFYIVNIYDKHPPDGATKAAFKKRAENEKVPILFIHILFESELNIFSPEEAATLQKEAGLEKTLLELVIETSYHFLGLVTFLTYSANECKSWVIQKGKTALEAAAMIHSDMAKGFIKAEVISFEELKIIGSIHQAHSHGKIRLEGKNYFIQEGDVVHFKFNS